ncbi:non-structural maintenance of chromosomes element 4 homolog A-like [Punica granatum]|uniref:Non-structural maintenance of chromosomes element 4 n=2 Tax=Punica granatum TaxID=22663 RepID=A0A218WA64_PUNGR|nr:non-structural maintenance of chromosomes element 4 homolog A-like [Punica granatum]OWM69240.1 hypothetical protein CDL15_Pgr025427 [Punica granatum]PKI61064.1 hypothetical protein CRG98_018509 [Punica granatum]
MRRTAKRKPSSSAGPSADTGGTNAGDGHSGNGQQDETLRRVLRSQFLAVKSRINDERDNLLRPDSDEFASIFSEVENLHQLVDKPREQVADAEALLDIASTLVNSVKSFSSEGITPSDFITGLLKDFGRCRRVSGASTSQNYDHVSVKWKDLGLSVSPIFRKGYGCCTMLGPMNTQLKQRKTPVHRKHTRPTESARPEELDDAGKEEKTDTDQNMATMFGILRRKRTVKLDHLILNRRSFAQTVENLFALSFLVKDGRAEISVDDKGTHLVSPRNAPVANTVTYSHFVFRFDFRDWKFMIDTVPIGEELMPHREQSNNSTATEPAAESAPEQAACNSEAALPTTPIRKLTRNRGLVVQEETVVEDSPEIEGDDSSRTRAIRKCKRKLR